MSIVEDLGSKNNQTIYKFAAKLKPNLPTQLHVDLIDDQFG